MISKRDTKRPLLVLGVMLLTVACGGGGGGGGGGGPAPTAPTEVLVGFEYKAPTTLDPKVDFETCTSKQVHFSVHLHFIWNDWEDRRSMVAKGDELWAYDGLVPANSDLIIALHDPNNCLEGDVYVAPDTLFANGVLLTQVTRVPVGTGLGLRVRSDGSVVP